MPYAANGVIAQNKIPEAIEITDDQYTEALEGMCAGLVVTIEGGFKLVPQVLPEQEGPSKPIVEDPAAAAFAQRDRLLSLAAIRIAPLQDAVDLGRATPETTAKLNQWKGYRVDLNEIDGQPDFPRVINWPQAPE